METPHNSAVSVATEEGLLARLPSRPIRLPMLRQTLQALMLIPLAFASYLFISHFLVQSVSVVGQSMIPTLHDSERYLLNRWIYYVRNPQRGEIVVLKDPAETGFSVKRVVGLPGDIIQVSDGEVLVNGVRLPEPYLPSGTRTDLAYGSPDSTVRCGQDQVYVLGDNRLNSVDSRSYGPVAHKAILGLVIR